MQNTNLFLMSKIKKAVNKKIIDLRPIDFNKLSDLGMRVVKGTGRAISPKERRYIESMITKIDQRS